MENIKRPVASLKKQAGPSRKNNRQNKSMTTLTTNRFFTKALRTLCCASALTACSAWATVVTWQLSPGASGSVGATKALPQSGYATAAWGVDKTPVTDASHAFLFRTAPGSGVSETSAAVPGTLNNKPQASDTYIQMASQSTLSQGGGQISARSTQPDESSLFASSNTPAARPTTELDEAMAKTTFDEDFVSVPTVQFASSAMGSRDISMTSVNSVTSVPEMSALFPIVGLIAAVSCTQILRRRRAAQQSAPRSRA